MNRDIRGTGPLAGLSADWINVRIDTEAAPEHAPSAAFAEMATRQTRPRIRRPALTSAPTPP